MCQPPYLLHASQIYAFLHLIMVWFTATETYENIGTKSDQGAEPTSGVITESQGNGGPEPTPTKQIKSPDEQKAKNSTCRQVSLSFLLVAVCLFMQLAGWNTLSSLIL